MLNSSRKMTDITLLAVQRQIEDMMKSKVFASIFLLAGICVGQNSVSQANQHTPVWHDPSPHSVQFITVEKNVKLEVLDWGGKGRPVVLLAGLGNTAHIFDDFAPRLAAKYHVYGVTRRGFGASSVPTTGYSADRLGDDVLAVLNALKLQRPVLVGHSIAGEELSSIGSRYLKRIAGLIYLDAAYSYAYYDPTVGDFSIDSQDLQKKMKLLQAMPPDTKQLVQEMLQTDLPGFERDLRQLQKTLEATHGRTFFGAGPTATDLASFPALQAWQSRERGGPVPMAELYQTFESKPGGGVGRSRTPPFVFQAIISGEQKYSTIRVPILAIYAVPHNYGPSVDKNPAVRDRLEALDTARTETQIKALKRGEPSARVIELPDANHYIFISNETDVLHKIEAFISSLPK